MESCDGYEDGDGRRQFVHIRIFHKKYMQRVVDDGPCHFEGFLVALEVVKDETPLRKESLTTIQIWMQIHGLPLSRVVPATAEKT